MRLNCKEGVYDIGDRSPNVFYVSTEKYSKYQDILNIDDSMTIYILQFEKKCQILTKIPYYAITR